MTPERLASLRRLTENCDYHDDGDDSAGCTCAEPLNGRRLMMELLEYVDVLAAQNTELRDSLIQVTSIVDELTRQRDDARRMCVDSGYFQDHRGEVYDLDTA